MRKRRACKRSVVDGGRHTQTPKQTSNHDSHLRVKLQEHEKQLARIKKKSREEAQKGLDADTRRIITDNRRMVCHCTSFFVSPIAVAYHCLVSRATG